MKREEGRVGIHSFHRRKEKKGCRTEETRSLSFLGGLNKEGNGGGGV